MKLQPAEPVNVRLADAFGRSLTWVRPGLFGRDNKLVADRDTLVHLRWRGLRSADAVTATGRWTIRRVGLVGITAEVIDADTQRVVLSIRTRLRSGTFETPDGLVYEWKRTRFFRLEIGVNDPNGSELLRCSAGFALGRGRGTLTLGGAAANQPLLDPLVLATWYVLHRLRQRRRRA
jgi:hypothetical protein